MGNKRSQAISAPREGLDDCIVIKPGIGAYLRPNLRAIPIGSHLVTRRFGYNHHGIYVGHGQVIHYAGKASMMQRTGKVEITTFSEFRNYREEWIVRSHPFALFSGREAAKRARSRVNENAYELFSNNCEHLCYWCLYNVHESKQVKQLKQDLLGMETADAKSIATAAARLMIGGGLAGPLITVGRRLWKHLNFDGY